MGCCSCGTAGLFVVWRRMAYFGDTLSHSALLGVSFGLLLDFNLNLAVIGCSLFLAFLLVTFQEKQRIASDTLLGILAHSSLSLGLVAVSFADNVRVDMMAYLFGDLLAVGLTISTGYTAAVRRRCNGDGCITVALETITLYGNSWGTGSGRRCTG